MRWLIHRILNKFLEKINLTFYITLNNRKIKIPIITGIGYSNLRTNELWMIDLLKKLLPLKDGAFIDIGMNVGQTLIKLKCVSPDVQYFGFEPNPLCVYYTRELIKKNGFKNCEIIPVGISNKNGIAILNCYNDETDSSATIVDDFRLQQKIKYKLFVPVQSFDYVYGTLNLEKISIIKIDVEGSELEVITSLKSVLRKNRPIILCEILPPYSITSRRTRQEKVKKIIKALNYDICRIQESKNGCLGGLIRIENFNVHSDPSLQNYLFVPNEIFDRVFNQLNFQTNCKF